MSKAFTREENEGPELPDLPPRESALPFGAKNYMTRAGANRLRDELVRLVESERPRLIQSAEDSELKRKLAKLGQRIFQIEQSLESAEIVSPAQGAAEHVTFGTTVVVQERGGTISTYRIVGVDEIDAERGCISWLSPIAKALMNKRAGDRVLLKTPSGNGQLEIVSISYE